MQGNHPRNLGFSTRDRGATLGATPHGPICDDDKKEQGETRMSIEENKALVRRFDEEFWNSGNMAAANELIAEDATITLPGVGLVNRESLKVFARAHHNAFPDWHSTLEEMVGEGEIIAERWTGTGTHQGDFQGIAPTGRHVKVPGVVFYHIASGKIMEFHGLFDGLAMMQQLDTVPAD
jgi:steroid delta-isomerase-like uncharacterized protein